MNNHIWKIPWLRKLVYIVLAIEISYLVLFNLVLHLPGTQPLINQLRPEKFHISWEEAWTWYPFRIHLRNASGHGQSRSQQWEFQAQAVSASIDLLPLMIKRVWIDGVVITDASYRQRPRLKPETDYTDLEAFFPTIKGREPALVDTTPRQKKRPWHVDIEDIELNGHYSYWIHQLRGQSEGTLEADLEIVSRGGPFSMDVSRIDLELDTHYLKGETELFRHAAIKGELGLAPFVPRENKGVNLLKFLSSNADIEIDVSSLAFLDSFAQGFNAMTVDGHGLVNGHLQMETGRVLEGTKLEINAGDIGISLLSHSIQGNGNIEIKTSPATNGLLDLKFRYNDLSVKNDNDNEPFLIGQGLNLDFRADANLFPAEGEIDANREMSLDIGGLSVPDLALLQRYLPVKWPLRFYGGKGELHGQVKLASNSADVNLKLTSETAELGGAKYRFGSNLDIGLKVHNPSLSTSTTTVSGSYIKLTDAILAKNTGTESQPWQADFSIKNGHFSTLEIQQEAGMEDATDIFRVFGQSGAKQLLGNLNGTLEIESNVSSLAWIGVLMNERYRTSTSGSGKINAIVNMESGMPAEGTNIEIESKSLIMTIMDYIVSGDGKIVFKVEQGGEEPDWLLLLDINDGDMKRSGELTAPVHNVDLNLRAFIADMSFEDKDRQFELELKIPAARVDDVSVFNGYFPPESPFFLTSGTADLSVDILLKHDDADGYVKLAAGGVEGVVGEQAISADLNVNISLVDGVPAEMMFDISGSEISLNNVRVAGENESFNQQNWSALLTFTRANTTWVKPISLKAEANLQMTDSRPIVAILGNQKDRPKWVKNMLTIEDIEGTLELDVADNQIVIPYAFVDSDNIDFGAKGVIDEKTSNGMVYARYKKLGIVVKINDGKKNIDLIRAKGKFDAYQPSTRIK